MAASSSAGWRPRQRPSRNASRAAATARSTVAASALGTSASGSSVAGFSTGISSEPDGRLQLAGDQDAVLARGEGVRGSAPVEVFGGEPVTTKVDTVSSR